MRDIEASLITKTVAELCQRANFVLDDDVLTALKQAQRTEESPLGKEVLGQVLENARIAREECVPLCQDCGSSVVFLEIGQDAHVTGGDLYTAVNEGVRQGYTKGYLRKSIVKQPFSARVNTKDNTPAFIHTDVVPGDRIKVTVMPKGGGSENMTRLAMLKPGEGKEGVIAQAIKVVKEAGGNACPPMIVGLGIGGTADMAMVLSKKALLRPLGQPSPDPEVADLEKEALSRINRVGSGPQGIGGSTTALAVHAEVSPTHIASLPVAVNLQCHSARHREAIL